MGGALDRRLSRRQVLSLAGASLATRPRAARAQVAASSARSSWGVQLYTVRSGIQKDPAATIARLAGIGYRELEVLQPTLPIVAPLAKAHNLSIVSAHLDEPTSTGEGLSGFIAQAKSHGLKYLVVPWVPPTARPTNRQGFEQFAARLSRMAGEVAAAGLQLCYHNHAFEFGTDRDGTTWLDVLMERTAQARMALELDVFWAAIAGGDPVALLDKYRGRVALVHLKDKNPKAAQTLVELKVERDAFVEVGAGALDFPRILDAARRSGVQHYFVEQDATPGDPVDSLAKSFAYLNRGQ
jgi:sugar phosphate isomerase/epimerase